MKYLKEVNLLARRHNLLDLLCRGLRKFSELMCAKGNFQQAEHICKAALNIAKTNALWRYEMYLRCVLAEVFRLTGRTQEALALFEKTMPIAATLGITGWVGHIRLVLGNCNADAGNQKMAQEHYVKARELYEEIGQTWGAINLEVAHQRSMMIAGAAIDADELARLKKEAVKLGYNVLSKKIDGLLAGKLDPIRFEYL
jgi:tetratricopeptide (TPR) repeat protein